MESGLNWKASLENARLGSATKVLARTGLAEKVLEVAQSEVEEAVADIL